MQSPQMCVFLGRFYLPLLADKQIHNNANNYFLSFRYLLVHHIFPQKLNCFKTYKTESKSVGRVLPKIMTTFFYLSF